MKKISVILILLSLIVMMFACTPENITNPNGMENDSIIGAPVINVYYKGELITKENPLDFGEVMVGEMKEVTVVIANEGTATLFSPAIKLVEGDEVFKADPIGIKSIPAGHKFQHNITFKVPADKNYKAIFRIDGFYYDNSTEPPQVEKYATYFTVRGTGVYKPVINVYYKNELITVDNPYDFGMVVVNQTKTVELTIKNEGNASLHSPQLNAISTAEFKLPILGMRSIAPGSSIDIKIGYKPSDEGHDAIIPYITGFYYPNGIGGVPSVNYTTNFKCIGYGVYVY